MTDPHEQELQTIINACQSALAKMELGPRDRWFAGRMAEATAMMAEFDMPSRHRTKHAATDRDGMENIVT